MNYLVKIVLGLVAAVALLFVALIVAVTLIIEPNDYRPYIVTAVEDATGRTFELEGDLGLKLLPCCSVSLGSARLGNPAGFPEAGFPENGFASLASAALSIKLWPLIARREVEIGTVTLTGLDLDLVRLADGRVNWEFESETPDPDPTETAPIRLSVERLVLGEGQVRYRDLETGQRYTVTELALDTRLAMSGDRVTVSNPELALTVAGSELPEPVRVDMRITTLVATLDDAASVTIDGLALDLESLGARLRVDGAGRAGSELALSGTFELAETSPRTLLAALSEDPFVPADGTALQRLAAEGRWTVGDSSATVDGLILTLDDSRLTGSAAVTDFDSSAMTFDLALDRVDVDRYASADGTAAASPDPAATTLPLDALAGVPVDGRLRVGRLRASGLDVNDLMATLTSRGGEVRTAVAARIQEASLELNGGGNVSGAEPALAGTLSITGLSPRKLLAALDAAPETADPNVLQRLAGTARWRLTPDALTLPEMRWQLDDTAISGSAGIADFDTLAARFDIVLDRLNADAYLAPETDDESDPDAEIIPVELIRDLDLRGRVRAGELTLMKLSLRDVVAQVSAANGVLRLDPLTAALYGGTYSGTVVIDATGPKADLSLDQTLAGVQVSDLLGTLFATDLLGGSLSFKLAGSGRGNTSSDLLRALAADVSLDLTDGVYRGADIGYQIRRARALLKKEPAPEAPAQNVTPIRALKATGRMVDGVLQTNQLSAETDALRLLGKGGINLIELALDYDLQAQVLSAGAGAAKLGDLANATIPITLSGPLMSPKVGVDMQGLVTSAVRDTVQQKAREALLKKLGGDEPEQTGGAGSTQVDPASGAAEPAATEPEEPPSTKDLLKRGLRDLLKPKEPAPEDAPG